MGWKTQSLQSLLNEDFPCVAVSFADDATDTEIAKVVAGGMDIAELRIDRFSDVTPDHVAAVLGRYAHLPTIATIRSATEGGGWDTSDTERLALFATVIPLVDAIDIELSSTAIAHDVIGTAHAFERDVIVSFHDFDATPETERLDEIIHAAVAAGADVVKVAAMVTSAHDLHRLADVIGRHRDSGVIVIGMGPQGTPSRALFPFLGSQLTFASANQWSAPGQLTLGETASILRTLSPGYRARHPET